MKRILFIAVLLALICAGCIEKKSNEGKSAESPSVTITSPKGDILSGDKEVKFDSAVNGGSPPYGYSWSSNIKGTLSSGKSFSVKPSQLSGGRHIIILTVTDAKGNSAQSSKMIRVV
jgi:hypothetical protein